MLNKCRAAVSKGMSLDSGACTIQHSSINAELRWLQGFGSRAVISVSRKCLQRLNWKQAIVR